MSPRGRSRKAWLLMLAAFGMFSCQAERPPQRLAPPPAPEPPVAESPPLHRHVRTSEVRWLQGATFKQMWNDPSKRFYTSIILGPDSFLDGTGTFLPADDEDMILSVLVPTDPPDESTGGTLPLAMRFQITSLVEVPGGLIIPQVFGDPPVICDLTGHQAAEVWIHGVPQSLLREMVRVAKAASWKPLPERGMSRPLRPAIGVAAEPYFARPPKR